MWNSRRNGVGLAFVAMLLALWLSAGDELPEAPQSLRILSYNVRNWLAPGEKPVKPEEERREVVRLLARSQAHILVLFETGGQAVADELRGRLKEQGREYPFASCVKGVDPVRRILVLSQFVPEKVDHETQSTYKLKGEDLRVQRGFAHLLFAFRNGYRLHLLGMHLKSKVFHSLGQTDMRRNEARRLRKLCYDLMRADPQVNLLVVGDLNDEPDSSPFNTVISRRSKDVRQFYDLRPLDAAGVSWTHWWNSKDNYSRIDFALASYCLLPEIDFGKIRIFAGKNWEKASDHRALLTVLKPEDQNPTPETLLPFSRNIRR